MIKPGYRNTAVGVIPEDWEVKRLKTQAEVDKENLGSDFQEEFIDYVSLSDVENGKIFPIKTEYKLAPSRAKRITKRGDVLLATVRPNLKNFAIVDRDNIIASTGFSVLSQKVMNLKFLYFFLFSQIAEKQYYSLIIGSNYPALNSDDVKNLKLPIPPLPEQKAIADCLSTWDRAIEKQTKLIEAKKQFKKGLMQGFFGGELTVATLRALRALREPQGTKNTEDSEGTESCRNALEAMPALRALREPQGTKGTEDTEGSESYRNALEAMPALREPQGTKNTEDIESDRNALEAMPEALEGGAVIIKAKDGEDFTEDWEEVILDEVFDFYPNASYSRDEEIENGEIQHIHYGDIHTKFNFNLVCDQTIPKLDKSKLKNYESIQVGDLILADTSEDYEGVGKSVEILKLSNIPVIAGLHTFHLRPKSKKFALGFLGYLVSCDSIKKQFHRLATGIKVFSLSKSVLKTVAIPLPPLGVQSGFAEILKLVDKEIQLQEKKLAQLQLQKKGLMQVLLTGEKRLVDS